MKSLLRELAESHRLCLLDAVPTWLCTMGPAALAEVLDNEAERLGFAPHYLAKLILLKRKLLSLEVSHD